MNNQNVIQKIQEESERIFKEASNFSIQEFKLGDLKIENGIFLNDVKLTGNAQKSVLNALRVRSNFTDLEKKMSPEDWYNVSKRLQKAESEHKMYAKVRPGSSMTKKEIISVFNRNENKKKEDNRDMERFLGWITDSLAESEKEYSLKSIGLDASRGLVDLTLLDNNSDVDMFGTGVDIWKTGERFSFGGVQFNYAPFFERLSCSNGNTGMQYGFNSNITQSKYNNQKIQSIIEKALIQNSETMSQELQHAVRHLQSNNISIAEFYHFRKWFERKNQNDNYDKIIYSYLDDSPFYQAYGTDVKEKSNKWQSTANSGICAYDFFNMLTYIASHPEKISMEYTDRADLQIKASDLLFKKQLDLEDVAKNVKVDYPQLIEML
ncbi:MAG: hypothetical protein RLZZ479_254 [Bacteroidota bacterium]|jgi:hypothetical protein